MVGSRSAASRPGRARLPRGPAAPGCHSGAPAARGPRRLAEEATRSSRCAAPLSAWMRPARSRPAPGYRPKMGGPNSSALCIALIRTFQNLRHLLTGASAGPSTCHFRFLLLELSLPNADPVPEGTSAVAMATRAPPRRYWPRRPGRPPTLRPPQPRALRCPNPTGNEERLENSSCSCGWCCPTPTL